MAACCDQTVALSVAGVLLLALLVSPVFGVAGGLLLALLVNCLALMAVVSSGGAPTPAGTSVFTKHNWDMGMGYLWLNGWGIYDLMGGAFMT